MTSLATQAGRSSPRHVARWLGLGSLVIAAALVALLATRPSAADNEAATPLLDKPAPSIAGTTVTGRSFDLASLRGEWVLVNFFASWCAPCQQEESGLVSFYYEHRTTDVTMVGVVYDDSVSDAYTFMRQNGATWPAVLDPTGQIAIDYGVRGPPETFIVSPTGIVLAHLIGPVTDSDLEAYLAQAERAVA